MHTMGWAQLAHFAQVRALADGRASIDPWHWETKDKAWVDGHFYSVKAPGLPLLALPGYLALDAAGASSISRDAAENASRADHPRWTPPGTDHAYLIQYGYDPERAIRVENRIEDETPMVWTLTLVAAVIPAVLLLLLVRPRRARLRGRRGHHAGPGDNRDDVRSRVLLSCRRGRTRLCRIRDPLP
jgi:hypothetical protein